MITDDVRREAVARETARIIAEGIAKELGMTPGDE